MLTFCLFRLTVFFGLIIASPWTGKLAAKHLPVLAGKLKCLNLSRRCHVGSI